MTPPVHPETARSPSSVSARAVDAAIVGGGPAGLAAAAWLARCGRRVHLLDTGEPRNAPTWAVHGYPGLSDQGPHELRRRLRDQALGAGAEASEGEVTEVSGERDAFVVRTAEGQQVAARRLLLAYGRRDSLPNLPGAAELYGTSLFHCPDCDGPSTVGAVVGVLGADRTAAALALLLSFWAESVTLLPHRNGDDLDEESNERLARYGIQIRPGLIREVDARAGRLHSVTFEDGDSMPVECLFFPSSTTPACAVAEPLGCECDEGGHVIVDNGQETTIRGVFAAGDITGHPYLAISAAAEGVRAALAIHRSLLPDDFRL